MWVSRVSRVWVVRLLYYRLTSGGSRHIILVYTVPWFEYYSELTQCLLYRQEAADHLYILRLIPLPTALSIYILFTKSIANAVANTSVCNDFWLCVFYAYILGIWVYLLLVAINKLWRDKSLYGRCVCVSREMPRLGVVRWGGNNDWGVCFYWGLLRVCFKSSLLRIQYVFREDTFITPSDSVVYVHYLLIEVDLGIKRAARIKTDIRIYTLNCKCIHNWIQL